MALAVMANGARAEVRTCTDADTASVDTSIGWNDADSHALFQIAPITYSHPEVKMMGLEIAVVVDTDGRITCMVDSNPGGSDDVNGGDNKVIHKAFNETPERRALLSAMDGWRFKPFLDKGKPVVTETNIFLPEKIDFHFHEDAPVAPASTMTVKLTRTGCYGSCPSYSITLQGSGWAEFEGGWYTDIRGKYVYAVDPARVAALMDKLKTNDIWSMAGNWVGNGFDAPRYDMDVTIGGVTRHFADFFGKDFGMPKALTDFMDAVDEVGRSDDFIHLSSFSVQRLEREGFDFKSQKGADLFYKAINGDKVRDDAGLLRLIELGVPVMTGRPSKEEGRRSSDSPIDAALRHRHDGLIDPLLSRGALETGGKPNQVRIDSAFQAAIAGGRLAAVQRIWSQAGTRPHPSLFFKPQSFEGKKKRSSVTLLLKRDDGDTAWEGLEIAQWLIGQGCDLRASDADGKTLLDIAVEADDIPMVKYLIAQGVAPNAPTYGGSSALGGVDRDEDMAMLLIAHGADPWALQTDRYDFVGYSRGKGWTRVVAWMEAHKPNTVQVQKKP